MKDGLINLINRYSNYSNLEEKIIASIYGSLRNVIEIWNILYKIPIQVDEVCVLNIEKVSQRIKVFDKY